jgi:hypothetical protein
MKFLIVTVAAAMLVGAAAEAAPKRRSAAPAARSYEQPMPSVSPMALGMAGCGLGSLVVEDRSKWAQVASAFLNGTGVQTFGISFGTSNCTEDGVAQMSREKDAFVEANLSDIRRDVAAGEGEYLSSLNSLYGCQEASFTEALRNEQNLDAGSINQVAASLGCQG